jgi:hypothetical protein
VFLFPPKKTRLKTLKLKWQMEALVKANDGFIKQIPDERHCHLEPLAIQPNRGDIVGHQNLPVVNIKYVLGVHLMIVAKKAKKEKQTQFGNYSLNYGRKKVNVLRINI